MRNTLQNFTPKNPQTGVSSFASKVLSPIKLPAPGIDKESLVGDIKTEPKLPHRKIVLKKAQIKFWKQEAPPTHAWKSP